MRKILSISLGPFTSFQRARFALLEIFRTLFGAGSDNVAGSTANIVQQYFQKYFTNKEIIYLGSGRESLLMILKALDLPVNRCFRLECFKNSVHCQPFIGPKFASSHSFFCSFLRKNIR